MQETPLTKQQQVEALTNLLAYIDIPPGEGHPRIEFRYFGDPTPIADYLYEQGVRYQAEENQPQDEVTEAANNILEGVDDGNS